MCRCDRCLSSFCRTSVRHLALLLTTSSLGISLFSASLDSLVKCEQYAWQRQHDLPHADLIGRGPHFAKESRSRVASAAACSSVPVDPTDFHSLAAAAAPEDYQPLFHIFRCSDWPHVGPVGVRGASGRRGDDSSEMRHFRMGSKHSRPRMFPSRSHSGG